MNGRDFITAIASGTDVLARIAKALAFEVPVDWTLTEGWFATQLFGYLSGAATAGRLLALDEDKMENAFGIAFNQFSGSRQMAVGAATHMRSMQAGFSGQGGVLAAELAQRGIIGSSRSSIYTASRSGPRAGKSTRRSRQPCTCVEKTA